MAFNKNIHMLQTNLLNAVLYLTYILYIAIALGISANAPEYLDELQYYVKLYVSLFLIYRFNPFRRVKFTALDAKIAFNAGWLLLTTSIFNGVLKTYLDNIKQYLALFKLNT
jgi:hypothetical protein